jgi:hypothetical protein
LKLEEKALLIDNYYYTLNDLPQLLGALHSGFLQKCGLVGIKLSGNINRKYAQKERLVSKAKNCEGNEYDIKLVFF